MIKKELPISKVATYFPQDINALTLADRTRQRNHLRMRIKGASRLADHLGMPSTVRDFDAVLKRMTHEHEWDKSQTERIRKDLPLVGPGLAVAVNG